MLRILLLNRGLRILKGAAGRCGLIRWLLIRRLLDGLLNRLLDRLFGGRLNRLTDRCLNRRLCRGGRLRGCRKGIIRRIASN